MRQGNSSRRSRGRGNGKRQNRGNQIDSHGPEVRVRGSAQQVCNKYIALARDATSVGDRISAENLYQHAEHYFRLVVISQEATQQRNENSGDNGNNTNENHSVTAENSTDETMELDENIDTSSVKSKNSKNQTNKNSKKDNGAPPDDFT